MKINVPRGVRILIAVIMVIIAFLVEGYAMGGLDGLYTVACFVGWLLWVLAAVIIAVH